MKDGQARRLQLFTITPWITCRSCDELDALVDHEADNVRVANKGLGDVDPERLVGQALEGDDLGAHRIQLARRCLDNAKPARLTNSRSERRAGDPAHGRLKDGVFDAQKLRDAVRDRHVSSLERDLSAGAASG